VIKEICIKKFHTKLQAKRNIVKRSTKWSLLAENELAVETCHPTKS